MALGLKLTPELAEVVQLAVVDDGRPAHRIPHGLGGRLCEVDDGKSTMSESDVSRAPDPGAVGAPMGHLRRCAADPRGFNRLSGLVENTEDSTHDCQSLFFALTVKPLSCSWNQTMSVPASSHHVRT